MKTRVRSTGLRFIGSKEPLLPFIERAFAAHLDTRHYYVADLFSGTASVAKLFKGLGHTVLANDSLFFCYALANAALGVSREPAFSKLLKTGEIPRLKSSLFHSQYDRVLEYLNSLQGIPGFIYQQYSPEGSAAGPYKRMYFSADNARKIDGIRRKLEEWRSARLIEETEFFLLISDLIRATNAVANIAGTYGCFVKRWEDRALKPLNLSRSKIIPSQSHHRALWDDANRVAATRKFDVIYLDPPYTWRHYGAYYHILETIARGDEPHVGGRTGLRPWEESKSRYCNRSDAPNALKELILSANCDHVFLSYNSEGLIPHDRIVDILSLRGDVVLHEAMHRRYLSNSGGSKSRTVKERLYYVQLS